MKKRLLKSITIIIFAFCSAIIWQGCPSDVPFDNTSWKVKSVKDGNTIVLDNLLTVKLLGIDNTPRSQEYLEQNVKGKTITLRADSKLEKTYKKPSEETVYAHISMKGENGKTINLNGSMILSGFAKYKRTPNNDSADVYLEYSKWEPHVVLTDEQLSLKMTPATFFIQDNSLSSFGITAFGTGFFISEDGLALTNNHVIEHVDNPELYTVYLSDSKGNIVKQNKRNVLRIIYTDPENDFTIFRVQLDPNEVTPCLFVSKSAPERGQHIGVVGNPRGMTATFSTGELSAIREDYNILQFNAPIDHGNSGGPICNNCGNVIGIVKSTLVDENDNPSSANLNFAVDIRYVREVLDQIDDIKYYYGK